MALAPAAQRRRSARLQLLGEVHGQLVGIDVPIVVRDISDGGFAILSTLEFPADAVHRFQLSLESDARFAQVAQVRVVHSRMVPGDTEVLYATGFEFTTEQPHTTREAVKALVDCVRAAADERPDGATGAERRGEARHSVVGELHGEVEALGVPLVLRDFSLGGCSVETHQPLEIGAVHFVRLDVYDSISVTLQARVAHSRRSRGQDRPTFYITGLQFIDPDRRQISELLELLTRSLRSE